MQKKLSKSKVASIGLVAALGILIAASVGYAASAKDLRLYLQAYDGSCTTGLGFSRHTDFVSKITGLGQTDWVYDSNGFDPDCFRINLNMATTPPVADLGKDFRTCLQFADHFTFNSQGTLTGVSQTGTQQCTPWASEGGGPSAWAGDHNLTDPDGAKLGIETRALPTGTVIEDVRFGFQMSDKECKDQFGTIRYTPWASAGGGWSSWAHDTNFKDPDCGRVFLEVKLTGAPTAACTQPVPESEQPKVLQDTTKVISMDGTGTGWKDCSSDSVLTNLRLDNGGADRKEWSGTCTDTENLVNPNSTIVEQGTTIVAPRIVYPTGDDAYCAQGTEAMIGALYYDDDANGSNDEGIRAIHCRSLVSGMTLDYDNIQIFSNAGCGQNECNSTNVTYGSLRTAKDANGNAFVPIGMNIRPNDANKYARGIWAAPLKRLPPVTGSCRVPPPAIPPVVTPPPVTPPPVTPPPPAQDPNQPPVNPPAASCTITATPTAITINVGSSKLEWSCTTTGSVSISDNRNSQNDNFPDIGTRANNSFVTVSPDKTTTFTVTSGGATDSVTVTVGGSSFDESGGL